MAGKPTPPLPKEPTNWKAVVLGFPAKRDGDQTVPFVKLGKKGEDQVKGVWGQKWLFGGRNSLWFLAYGQDSITWITMSVPLPPEPPATVTEVTGG